MDQRRQTEAEWAETTKSPADEHNVAITKVFTKAEHWITVGIGAILIVTTLALLTGTLASVIEAWRRWPAIDSISTIVDQLLFTLMLVEILHTVRQSIASDQITIEPFLIVGLIACVRRILIVTVEVADQSKSRDVMTFDHAMIELGVLGGLVLVLIISIYLSRHSRRSNTG